MCKIIHNMHIVGPFAVHFLCKTMHCMLRMRYVMILLNRLFVADYSSLETISLVPGNVLYAPQVRPKAIFIQKVSWQGDPWDWLHPVPKIYSKAPFPQYCFTGSVWKDPGGRSECPGNPPLFPKGPTSPTPGEPSEPGLVTICSILYLFLKIPTPHYSFFSGYPIFPEALCLDARKITFAPYKL